MVAAFSFPAVCGYRKMSRMKVLRLTSSMDWYGEIAPEERSMGIGAAALEATAGERVESIIAKLWPGPKAVPKIEEWMAEHQPGLVLLWVNPYWFTYESVPNLFDNRLGFLGPKLKRAGVKLGAKPAFNQSPAFGKLRGMVLKTVGGALYFQPEDIVKQVEEWIRLVLRSEEVALVVRGAVIPMALDADAAGKERCRRRMEVVDRGLAEVCRKLHVEYIPSGRPAMDWYDPKQRNAYTLPDGFHCNKAGHALMGELEAEAMVAAWRKVHAPS